MRILMRFQVPVDAGNKAANSGALQQTLERTLASLKPEAAYFYADQGVRTGVVVFDLKSTSDIPSIAEPLFMQLSAKVEFFPVMNVEDLQAGLKKALASV